MSHWESVKSSGFLTQLQLHYNSGIKGTEVSVIPNSALVTYRTGRLALCLKVATLEQLPVVLRHLLKPWQGGRLAGQAGEGHLLLVEQRLQSQAVAPTVIQRQDEVTDVGHYAAGAEGSMRLLGKVGGGQRCVILEEAEEGDEW